jgi:hypothetical protein
MSQQTSISREKLDSNTMLVTNRSLILNCIERNTSFVSEPEVKNWFAEMFLSSLWTDFLDPTVCSFRSSMSKCVVVSCDAGE